jgi:hypothetical protein
MKMDVFEGDGDAFLRYSLAEALNPKIVVRLFQSGPGTFWTNMDGKSLNMFVPTGASAAAAPTAASGAQAAEKQSKSASK